MQLKRGKDENLRTVQKNQQKILNNNFLRLRFASSSDSSTACSNSLCKFRIFAISRILLATNFPAGGFTAHKFVIALQVLQSARRTKSCEISISLQPSNCYLFYDRFVPNSSSPFLSLWVHLCLLVLLCNLNFCKSKQNYVGRSWRDVQTLNLEVIITFVKHLGKVSQLLKSLSIVHSVETRMKWRKRYFNYKTVLRFNIE